MEPASTHQDILAHATMTRTTTTPAKLGSGKATPKRQPAKRRSARSSSSRRRTRQPQNITFTDAELAEMLPADKQFHLAKTPFKIDKEKPYRQLYVFGYNIGGRPTGMWFANGGNWLSATGRFNNPSFPTCCYLYQIGGRANIIRIRNQDDFDSFDKIVPNYWINYDYFDVDLPDYTTDKPVRWSRRKLIDMDAIKNSAEPTLRQALVKQKIIFESAEDAMAGCEFYSHIGLPIDRFRVKDWGKFANSTTANGVIDGIVFETWSRDSPNCYWFWYQTLDAASGCIWDISSFKIKLLFVKVEINKWQYVGGRPGQSKIAE